MSGRPQLCKICLLHSCSQLQSLAETGFLRLDRLIVDNCQELTTLGNLQWYTTLLHLTVMRCVNFSNAIERQGGENVAPSSSLIYLHTDNLSVLAALLQSQQEKAACNNKLKCLIVDDCKQDIAFTPEQEKLFQQLTSLTHLCFIGCKNLLSFVTLKNLSSLVDLTTWNCPEIRSLPKLPAALTKLELGWHLGVKYGKDGPLHNKICHIPNIIISEFDDKTGDLPRIMTAWFDDVDAAADDTDDDDNGFDDDD